MANSYVFYPSETGAQADYSVPFEYLSQAFVKATVNGASVPFTFLSTYMIRFVTKPVGALKIYRETSKGPVNTYINGSILVDSQLNGSFLQSLHVSEEVSDNAMVTAVDGAWDAQNLKVKNVADPTSPQDVVNKRWAETVGNGFIGDAGAKAAAAAASAAAALADKNTVATDKGIVAADKAIVAADKATVAADKGIVLGYKNAADADKVATSGDRTQTGLDRVATAADRVQTGLDRVATGNDKVATAADRVQTGLDRTAASNSAAAAAVSAGSLTPVETQVHAATAQAIVDNDEIGFTRSAASWALGKITWANLKAAIKTYIQSAALSITGTLTATGDIQSGPSGVNGSVVLQGGSSIELGSGRTADGFAFIDFSSVVGADYNARLIRSGGTNAAFVLSNTGNGGIDVNAGTGVVRLSGAGILYNGAALGTAIYRTIPGNITISTAAPSGGADGDVWFRV